VGEAGRLQEKYWALKPLNHLQLCLSDWFSASEPVPDCGWTGPEGSFLRLRQTPRGALLFWSRPEQDHRRAVLSHPSHDSLNLEAGRSPHAILPLEFEVFPGHTLERSMASLLWLDEASRTVFLYAASGTRVTLSVDGEELEGLIPHQQPLVLRSSSGVQCVVLDEFLAGRFWPLEDGTICLGAYDMTGAGEPVCDREESVWMFSSGTLQSRSEPVRHRKSARTQRLPDWQTWQAVPSIPSGDWQPISGPCTHEELGVFEGGVWYRASLEAKEAGWQRLLVPAYGAGLVSVYHNGDYIGMLGESRIRSLPNLMERPRDQWREQLTVYLRPGRNEFLFYSEDMGRPAGGTPAPRGLSGDVVAGARPLELENLSDLEEAPVSQEAFRHLRYLDYPEPAPCTAMDFTLTAKPEESIQLSLPLPLFDLFADCFAVKTFAVEVEGQVLDPVGLPGCEMNTFRIPVSEGGGAVRVRILYHGSRQVLLSVLRAWGCPAGATLTDWSWSAFRPPVSIPETAATLSTPAASASRLLFPVSLDEKVESQGCQPTWYATTFPHPGDGRHFLRIGKLMKGQVYLNGHHIGRYWQKKPAIQNHYYLPTEWMEEENRLWIFEETGVPPVNTGLVTLG
jgi:hypothetical protein